MKIARRRACRGIVVSAVAASCVGIGMTLPLSSVAIADPGRPGQVDMNDQCRRQYPGVDGFGVGQAYQVAPRDAYSWRCARVGLSADLPVNVAAYCMPLQAQPAPDGLNWECR